jgi:hypothetical protein
VAPPPEPSKRQPEKQRTAAVPPPSYTQVNILFPATDVELPPADRFNEFPPEAQKALLEAFKTEQLQRHRWLHTQQHHDHELNKQAQANYFRWRMAGLRWGGIVAMTVLLIGAWMVYIGAPVIGVSMLIGAVAGLVGTAVYGHRAIRQEGQPQPENQVAAPAEQS